MTDDVDITTLDDEGLQAILNDADEKIRAAQDEKRAVKNERDRRAVMEVADTLSDAQKQMLAQSISDVGGIESAEATGTPGN